MRTITTCIIVSILFFTEEGISQRVWGNYEGNIAGELYTILQECEDTIINGEKWTELWAYTWYHEVQGISKARPRGYILERGTQEYWLQNGKEFLLYDFGMEIGDTVELGGIPRNRIFELIKVDSIVVLGKKRRRQTMKHVKLGYFDYWVEGIGSTKNHHLWPGEEHFIIDGGSWSICFRETKSGEIWKQESDTMHCYLEDYKVNCDSTLSTVDQSEDVKLYPNPWNQSISALRLEGFSESDIFYVYKITGELEFKGRLEEVNKSHFKPGWYIIEVEGAKGKLQYKLNIQ